MEHEVESSTLVQLLDLWVYKPHSNLSESTIYYLFVRFEFLCVFLCLVVPGLGAYSASKYALEAITESLRFELKPWQIHVCSIQPSNILTPVHSFILFLLNWVFSSSRFLFLVFVGLVKILTGEGMNCTIQIWDKGEKLYWQVKNSCSLSKQQHYRQFFEVLYNLGRILISFHI
jgi:hypothetical protein